MHDETLYTFMIEEHLAKECFVQVFWARGRHLGEAAAKALALARESGLTNPQLREADPFDIDTLNVSVHPSPAADAFYSTSRFFFPPVPAFTLPMGVVASCSQSEDAVDIGLIREGFIRVMNERGLTEIGINVEESNLLPLYERLLKLHEDYKVFWYLLHDHWEDGEKQIFTNSSLNTPEAIIAHLRKESDNSLLNGYVTLAAYFEPGGTNLNISDHKRIVILTYSDEVADTFERELKRAGLEQDNELVSVERGISHWHYRPPNSLPREALVKHLISQGFEEWNPGK